MKDPAAARRYARAMAGAMADATAQDRLLADLRVFERLLRSDTMFRAYLLDIRVKAERRAEIVDKVAAKAEFAAPTRHALAAVARHGRFEIFGEIVHAYSRELDRRRRVLRVKVRSARPMPEGQLRALEAALSKKTGWKVAAEAETEAGLLGGLTLQVDGMIYDASLRTQIENAAAAMAAQ